MATNVLNKKRESKAGEVGGDVEAVLGLSAWAIGLERPSAVSWTGGSLGLILRYAASESALEVSCRNTYFKKFTLTTSPFQSHAPRQERNVLTMV
jgi:hypothetical protein